MTYALTTVRTPRAVREGAPGSFAVTDMSAAKLLLIDDDARLTSMVGEYLRGHGFDVDTAGSLASGRERLRSAPYDALVLDLMLPDGDGLEMTRELRGDARTRRLPLLMLTARGEPMDRIIGLEIGADDYLAKPFNPRELLARARNVLRRWELAPRKTAADGVSRYRFAGWTLDAAARELIDPEGSRQTLTGAEYRLLLAFVSHPNRVLSRHQLIELTSTRRSELFDRSVDVRVSRLRQLLRDQSRTPHIIKTVYGDGYVLGAAVEVE